MTRSVFALLGACLAVGAALATALPAPQDETDGEALFTEEVRPLLEKACFECHGPHAERIRGGVMMSSHESLLEGGHGGPVIVPGEPEQSLLIEMVRESDDDFRMPPLPESPLAEAEIELLERWIALGAPWPGGEEVLRDHRDIDMEKGRQWWAFDPPEEPAIPELESPRLEALARNDIDRFVFAKLEEVGLEPAPEERDTKLVRRVYYDLLGLPPTPEEVIAFLRAKREGRWERLIDDLLARPEYGERQARAWLDVVRYAQTNGYERDEEKPMAWRYRDYVIRSFNEDKPYDRFLTEQLAGDELEDSGRDELIATGFYRIGAWDSEPDDRAQADMDQHDDVVRTISEGMLALTVGCARCHDHRTDPIRQADYYSLLAFVRNVTPYRRPKFDTGSSLLHALNATPEALRRREELRRESKDEARRVVDGYVTDLLERYEDPAKHPENSAARVKHVSRPAFQEQFTADERLQLYILKAEAEELANSFQGELDWALAVAEEGSEVEPTHVLKRGRVDAPQQEVAPAFPPVLCPDDESALPDAIPELEDSSGRRRVLADWITDPKHPLTARVLANRLWQGHFGFGIVETPNDFGVTGTRPSHPELLDWLALHLIESGWSVKELHRTILNSYTYRMQSSVDPAAAETIDPSNRLLWRQNLRRLDAESLRDACLAVAGSLNEERGGRGFFPALSREALAGASKPGSGWEVDELADRNRRAIYTFTKRGLLDPLQKVFDLANPNMPQGRRPRTTVASQALAQLNSEFLGRCATDLAARVAREEPGDDETRRIQRLYHLTLTRSANSEELEAARAFLASQREAFSENENPLRFSARKPTRMEVNYLDSLEPEDFYIGPEEGWSYQRGHWNLPYNQTEQYDRESGPSALLDGLALGNGEVYARLRFGGGTPFVGLLLRAHAAGESFTGLQVFFDRQQGEVVLLEHVDTESEPRRVASAGAHLADVCELRVVLEADEARVELDGNPVLSASGLEVLAPGSVGLRTWDAGCEVLELRLGDAHVLPPPSADAAQRALASFALVLLNTNEFLYID